MRLLFFLIPWWTTLAAPDPEWPQFRGPGSAGVAEFSGAPTTWSATENVQWRADVPGLGWSSPVVAGSRVFLTSVIRDGEEVAPQMGLYLGKKRSGAGCRWVALCYDLERGALRWRKDLHRGDVGDIHLKNSYASATPVTDGDRLYVWFGEVG